MEILDFCIFNLLHFHASYFILSRQTQKIYSFCFLGIGIAGYIQTMFLNRHLEQIGVRAEAYTASPSKIIVNWIIWTTIILGALLFAKFQQNIFKK